MEETFICFGTFIAPRRNIMLPEYVSLEIILLL